MGHGGARNAGQASGVRGGYFVPIPRPGTSRPETTVARMAPTPTWIERLVEESYDRMAFER